MPVVKQRQDGSIQWSKIVASRSPIPLRGRSPLTGYPTNKSPSEAFSIYLECGLPIAIRLFLHIYCWACVLELAMPRGKSDGH